MHIKFEESASLEVITEGKIADFLADKPEGLHIDELAKLSGLDSGKLGRILRMLATKHCFSEGTRLVLMSLSSSQAYSMYIAVDTNVFANNRLSIKLVSSDPVSSLVGHMYVPIVLHPNYPLHSYSIFRAGECLRAASYINESFVHPASPNIPGFECAFGTTVFGLYSVRWSPILKGQCYRDS